MKFEIDRNTISDAITNASKACSASSTIPALEGVFIRLKDDIITVTGYDLETGIKCVIKPDKIIEEGEIVVNAKIFGDMIRKMPNGIICIDVEGMNVSVTCGEIECNIIGMTGDNYPNIPELRNDVAFKVNESVLKSMIRQTIHAIAQSDIKPVFTGSKFEIKNNILNVVSVDGVRMAKRTEKVEYNDIDFVVPGKTLTELMRILSDDSENDILICIDRSQICFSRNDYIIISRLLEGTFIDYDRIMSFTEKTTAIVSVEEFSSSLERALLLKIDKNKCPVSCVFDNNILTVDIKTSLGKLNEKMNIKYEGERLEITFNAKYMLDALRSSECSDVRLDFTAAVAPIRIRPTNDEGFIGIVLPVRNR